LYIEIFIYYFNNLLELTSMLQVLQGLDPSILILLFFTGIIIGVVSAMVGIGGGILTVPILIFFFSIDATLASAISIIVIVFTSSSGSLSYYRQHRIDLRTGFIFASVVLPSAFIGGFVAENIDSNLLTIIFGLLMIVVAVRKILVEINNKRNGSQTLIPELAEIEISTKYGLFPQKTEERLIIDSDGEKFRYDVRLRVTLIGAAFGGFIGSMLGVGGGVIFVPLLNSVGGIPPHIAVATSTFVIVFSALSGSFSRILLGNLPDIVWQYVPFIALGSVLGARFGASKVKKVSSEKVILFFYAIVLVSGIRTIAKGLGIF
jgi:uncharacterized membrane protein YfcA